MLSFFEERQISASTACVNVVEVYRCQKVAFFNLLLIVYDWIVTNFAFDGVHASQKFVYFGSQFLGEVGDTVMVLGQYRETLNLTVSFVEFMV